MKVTDIKKIVSILIVEHGDKTEEKIALAVEWDIPLDLTRGLAISGAKTVSDAVMDYFESVLEYGNESSET